MELERALAAHVSSTGVQSTVSGSQTPIWLAFGVLLGIAYSLGTNKYERAMHVPHIFVRGAMLWLSCASWLGAATAISFVCYKINQQNRSLDGLDRLLSVLVPVIVRTDLIVDWAKRVMWAVFLNPTWTQGCVALRRILCRSQELQAMVTVDTDVLEIASVCGNDFSKDLTVAEELVWAEGAESLARFSEMLEHLQKLARVSVYAGLGLVFAVPGALIWIIYGAYKGHCAWKDHFKRLAILYWVSLAFAPLGSVVVVFVSVVLLVGIVTLSVLGACIQFTVYWSTRIVYIAVRMMLAQAWADFPFLMLREGAGAAAALLSSVHFPTGAAFSARATTRRLSDPTVPKRPMERIVSDPIESEKCLELSDLQQHSFGTALEPSGNINSNEQRESEMLDSQTPTHFLYHGKNVARHPAEAGAAIARVGAYLPTDLEFILASWDGGVLQRGKIPSNIDFVNIEAKEHGEAHEAITINGLDHQAQNSEFSKGASHENEGLASEIDTEFPNSYDTLLLRRLGMDEKLDTPEKRRLSTYYALGMLVQMQVGSGGNSWQLQQDCLTEPDVSDVDSFIASIALWRSKIAVEGAEAVLELSERLRASGKYRFVPMAGKNAPVDSWIRAVFLCLLKTPPVEECPNSAEN